MNRIVVTRVATFREDDTYVALCPDLDVSSFGDTPEQAKLSLHEALEGFLEACEAMGTSDQVLQEAGFARRNGSWLARQPITTDPRNVPVTHILTNLRTAGISRERYFELLQQV